MSTLGFLRPLLSGPLPDERVSSAARLRRVISDLRGVTDTVERAALAGFAADGVGWAFAGGYQAALTRVDPEAVAGGRLAALCATEEGGGHPRAMLTELIMQPDGNALISGRKTFVTLGADADLLLLVVKAGEDQDGRSRLRIARVSSRAPGVSLQPLDPLPFAPEVGHASVTLERVPVSAQDLLEGDGYERVLKPFRTIEDLHVMAAIVAWSIGIGRASGWGPGWMEEAASLLALLRTINEAPPLGAETHVGLAGALASVKKLLDGAPWQSVEASVRERWQRDRPLLEIASRVREARREAAWRSLREG